MPSVHLGVAIVVTADGQVFDAGDTQNTFAIESISKVVSMTLVMEALDADALHASVGADPTACPPKRQPGPHSVKARTRAAHPRQGTAGNRSARSSSGYSRRGCARAVARGRIGP